ncbi:MAG: hypothetical protein RL190_214 [Actinomycetota bacterium]|jgi:glycosyltransferase involved in cell wall biosynthesis
MRRIILREPRPPRRILRRHPEARGPNAVAAGLLRGLDAIGQTVFVDRSDGLPLRSGDRVGVLSGPTHLRRHLQGPGPATDVRIVVGPNVCMRPTDIADVDWRRADAVVVPSPWVAEFWADDAPQIADRIVVWAAGVDTELWAPDEGASRTLGLVYDKGLGVRQTAAAVDALARVGLEPRIIRYGEYRPRTYRSLLRRAAMMVWLSPSESQGMALLEAWSAGVPTLCVDPVAWRASGAPPGLERSSPAPYLSASTGALVPDHEDMRSAAAAFAARLDDFEPRHAAVTRFSLAAAARSYLAILDGAD